MTTLAAMTRLLSPKIIASLLFKRGIKWRECLLFNYKVRLKAQTGQKSHPRTMDWILGCNCEYNLDCSIAPYGREKSRVTVRTVDDT
jgi:hypothetical protein